MNSPVWQYLRPARSAGEILPAAPLTRAAADMPFAVRQATTVMPPIGKEAAR